MWKLGVSLLLLALTVAISHAVCSKPKVASSTYSTDNSHFSTESVFIAEVDVDCGGEAISLHALVGEQLLPVSRGLTSGSTTTNKFQVSWTEEHDKAVSGKRVVKFYDDEGTSSVRKALRYGEEITASPLFTVDIDYKTAKGEMPLSPAFIALVVALLVWWLANTAKTKLQE